MRVSDYFVPEHHLADVDRDDEENLVEAEREREWQRQQRSAYRSDDTIDRDWSIEDDARVERALSELRREYPVIEDGRALLATLEGK